MTNPICEICGKPATSWMLRDPFGKSDAKRPLCAEHAPQFHNPADVAEIERLRKIEAAAHAVVMLWPDFSGDVYQRLVSLVKGSPDEPNSQRIGAGIPPDGAPSMPMAQDLCAICDGVFIDHRHGAKGHDWQPKPLKSGDVG